MWQGGWTRPSLKVPSNPNHYGILHRSPFKANRGSYLSLPCFTGARGNLDLLPRAFEVGRWFLEANKAFLLVSSLSLPQALHRGLAVAL